MNLRGRFGLSCRTSSRVNLLRRRPVLHSNAESAGAPFLGYLLIHIGCLSSGTAGNRTPRRVDGMNWRSPSPVPFVPVPRAVSRRGAASNITIYNLEAAGGIEPPTSEEVAFKSHPRRSPSPFRTCDASHVSRPCVPPHPRTRATRLT